MKNLRFFREVDIGIFSVTINICIEISSIKTFIFNGCRLLGHDDAGFVF